jgi:hypothetical protein
MRIFTNSKGMNRFAVNTEAAPVLNTAGIKSVFGGVDGKSIKIDEQGLIREIEFIALPGTVFEVMGEAGGILRVRTINYDNDNVFYVDRRFVEMVEEPKKKDMKLPPKEKIYEFLDNAVGAKYIWGGNFIKGIDKMLEYYRPAGEISNELKTLWTLKGCDCSGLMYEATDGWTKRNTSSLIYSGVPIEIESLTAREMSKKLEPLDMIVWKGHVIYVYDERTAIQSALSKGGVVKTDLIATLDDLMTRRKPVNEYDESKWEKRFVVRRWFEG